MSPAAKTSARPWTWPCASTGMKPSTVCGRPSIRRPRRRGQGDDAVGRDRSLGDEAQLPVHQLDRAGAGLNGDSPLLQQLPHRLASGAPEQLQRLLLRRDERELDVVEPALGEVGRGHQRELVDRQRPDRSPWDDEGDPLHLARDDLLEQLADLARCPPARGRSGRPGPPRSGWLRRRRAGRRTESSSPAEVCASRPPASTPASAPDEKVAPAAAASSVSSNCLTSPRSNGSATASGRYQN